MSHEGLDRLRAELAGEVDSSLLDVVDHLLGKGCVITGNLVLGLAEVDLVYVELTLLICAAERLIPPETRAREQALRAHEAREREERGERARQARQAGRTAQTERGAEGAHHEAAP